MTAAEIRKQLVVSLSRMSALGSGLSIEAVGSEMLAVLSEIAAQLAEANANLGEINQAMWKRAPVMPEDIVRGMRHGDIRSTKVYGKEP